MVGGVGGGCVGAGVLGVLAVVFSSSRYTLPHGAMKVKAPPTNAIVVAAGDTPKYAENAEEREYLILYPEDYQGHGIDVAGNVALLVNEENARELKALAESAIKSLNGGERDEHRLAGAEPATQPEDAPRDNNDDPAYNITDD